MVRRWSVFRRGEQGQGMTEYIIIVALIALVALGAAKIFGGKIAKMFEEKGTALEDGLK